MRNYRRRVMRLSTAGVEGLERAAEQARDVAHVAVAGGVAKVAKGAEAVGAGEALEATGEALRRAPANRCASRAIL